MSFKPEIYKQYEIDDIITKICGKNQAMWYMSGSSPDHVHTVVCDQKDDTIYNYVVEQITNCVAIDVKFYMKKKNEETTSGKNNLLGIPEILSDPDRGYIEFDPEGKYQFYIYGCSRMTEIYNLIINTEKIKHEVVKLSTSDRYWENEYADLVYNSSFTPILGTTYTLSEIGKILYAQDMIRPVLVSHCEAMLSIHLRVFPDEYHAQKGFSYSMSHSGYNGLVNICDGYNGYVLALLDDNCGCHECELKIDMDFSDTYCWLEVYHVYGLNQYLTDKLQVYKSALDDKLFQAKCDQKYHEYLKDDKRIFHMPSLQFYDMNYPMDTKNFFNMLNVSSEFTQQ